jgi:hypothetical protein
VTDFAMTGTEFERRERLTGAVALDRQAALTLPRRFYRTTGRGRLLAGPPRRQARRTRRRALRWSVRRHAAGRPRSLRSSAGVVMKSR